VEKALENELSRKVGSISFTAPTFANMVLNPKNLSTPDGSTPDGDFTTWIENEEAKAWLDSWFHKIVK